MSTNPEYASAETTPDQPKDLFKRLGEAGANRDFAAGMRIVEQLDALNLGAETLRYRLIKAEFLLAVEQTKAGVELLKTLIQENRRNAHAFRILSDYYRNIGDKQQSDDILTDALTSVKDDNLRVYLLYQLIQSRLQRGMSDRQLPRFVEPVQAECDPRALCVMMIRDEGDVIFQNLAHHAALGIFKFVILDNNSSDDTSSEISRFQKAYPNCKIVKIADPVVGYFQAEKTQAAIDFGATYFSGVGEPVEWIFVLDADEFIVPPEESFGIKNFIDHAISKNRSIACFSLCNAASSIESFGRASKISQKVDEKFQYSNYNLFGLYPPKFVLKHAFALSSGVKITTGNHVVSRALLQVDEFLIADLDGWTLVHVPYRSIAQTQRKVMNGADAIRARGDDADIGRHWLAAGDRVAREGAGAAEEKWLAHSLQTRQASIKPV